MLAASLSAQAQVNPSAPKPFVEELRLQERERALREQQERAVDERLPAAAKAEDKRLAAGESPCFRIDHLVLSGERAEDFQWALQKASGPDGDDTPIGRCLGTQGVNTVLARVQQALIARGWVTTRVLAAPQDLAQGTLTLTLVPGRIAAIRFADDASTKTWLPSLRTAIPAQVGDLLNLRDIEQGLENLKRLPTAEADIQIEPSKAADAKPGDSDLVVKYSQKLPLRTTLSLDDSGTETTGKTQAGATVAWDNPLGLNDLLYVSLNHDAFNHRGSGTGGQNVHYSVPYGHWLLSATASQSKYHQSVAGLNQTYVYAGESRNAELKLSRLIYRDASRKTTLAVRAFRRASNNFIDDTEIEVQRRVVGGWEASVNHKEFVGDATFEGTLAYKRGTHAFGALKAPEDAFDEGTSYMRLFTAELSANVPFKLGEQKLRYSGLWRAQWNRTQLTPQDRFAIGGRYTVRGFDGESSLMGDRGWLVRNDIGWALGQSGAELYAGADYGQVGGRSSMQGLGNHLAGVAIGVRGAVKGAGGQLSYDVFVGAPIAKPEGYRTARVTGGINLNFSF
ncbi:MAG: ShlB/FhaC/HecB family hemolysin secretion/activation protein [Hyphomicrobiales bacterium]|nr:MAG: ShlB/FhaC/HecB family hemolysin secretion/activation protein [Hyphomicrobiales bacterium]